MPAPQIPFSLENRSVVRTLPGLDLAPAREPNARRDRIWELPPYLHCSIVGTCLTTAALRQLLAKLGQADAKTVSEHDIHSRGVRIAGQHDIAGKMLNRTLEKRHETHVKRLSKVKTADDVRAAWRDAFDRGDIPGAYWAALTHPASDAALVAEIFGEVHMLSHLVGTSSRTDLIRLRELESRLAERDEKIIRQEARLQRSAQEREAFRRRSEGLEEELRRKPAPVQQTIEPEQPDGAALKQRLEIEQARSSQLVLRIAEQDRLLAAHEKLVRNLEEEATALRRELTSLEIVLADPASRDNAAAPDLDGKRLLYVGGRPKQLGQIRTVVARLGGTLMTHDGGVEESTTLLPGLLGQADFAFFPVDCVSHRAAGLVKRFCRETGKTFVPLRNASVASFMATLGSLASGTGQAAS